MEKFSVQDEGTKRRSGIKALFVEIIVVILLIGVILYVMNYFEIIRLDFLSPQSDRQLNNQTQSENSNIPEKSSTVNQVNTQLGGNFQNNLLTLQSNKALHYSISETEFEGKISLVDTKAGTSKNLNIPFKVHLKISVGDGNDVIDILYPEEAIPKIRLTDSKGKVINFADLTPGDMVTIKTRTEQLSRYPNNFIEVSIIKNL
ncbi:MAG: hypothetical protein Q7T54_02805 [Candidatus Levybacteria bacterium]|nr:hypothetical protein [Candidatus Levybacteria bacterium]